MTKDIENFKTARDSSQELAFYLNGKNQASTLLQILDLLPHGVVAIDENARIFYTNPAYARILNVPHKLVLGRDLRKLEPEAALLQALDLRIPIKKTVLIKSINRYVRVDISLLVEGSQLKGAISFFHDVTKEVYMQEELQMAHGLADYLRRQSEYGNKSARLQLIGNAPNFVNAQFTAGSVAPPDASMLILGEHGVGKEVMARAIHANSSRCHKAFIAINCAALPETLLESELFGYEDGAFTGAARGGRLGKFELAHGGTLFLDKIGDMSFAMQAKILRALQEKEIEKIGRRQAVRIDVRVIAATNRDLKYLMTQGKFRQDLYYRLDVISIHIPPLRQRPGDVAILSEHFLRQCCGKYNKRLQLSSQSIQLLHAHDWPGNVRELQNCMEYAAIMCPGGEIMPWHLPNHLHHGAAGEAPETAMADSFLPGNWRQAIRQVEYRLLQNALQSTQGNRSAAIRSLGLSRRAFYHKLKQYKLE